MEIWTDPLKDDDKEIEVYDLASANHVGKIANDLHFAIFYMEQNMLKELGRMGAENFDRQVALVEKYITSSDTSTGTSTQITHIPDPLPSSVPVSVKAAFQYLNDQFVIERDRMNAELAEDTEQLQETLDRMKAKLTKWFKSQIGKAWLGGSKKVILSGTLMTYSAGDVEFEFYELEYD